MQEHIAFEEEGKKVQMKCMYDMNTMNEDKIDGVMEIKSPLTNEDKRYGVMN